MKVLVIGGGGREHAVCKKLSESKDVTEILCAPGNAGIAQVARCIPEVKATDIEGIVALAQREKVDFVCVTPDDPLALGCVDKLEAAGIPAFGPTAYAAQMEASKIFSKNLMRKYGIPTAKSETFTEMDKALAYLDTQGAPIVVKADGLALGKGVVVAATVEEAKQAVVEMMQGGKFGQSGARVLIEECMVGREVTVLCFCDGKTIVPMKASQDHKRALDGDKGPNTGGMGAFAPSPLYTDEIAERTEREILLPTLHAMNAEGFTFKGVLYVGLMLTAAPRRRPFCPCWKATCLPSCAPFASSGWRRRRSAGGVARRPASCWPAAAIPENTRAARRSPVWRTRRRRARRCTTRARD